MNAQQLMSANDVCEYFGICKQTLKKWMKTRVLDYEELGGVAIFNRADVESLRKNGRPMIHRLYMAMRHDRCVGVMPKGERCSFTGRQQHNGKYLCKMHAKKFNP